VNFRPVPARWFEVLAPRSDTARVLGTLARTGAVELEVRASEFGTLSIDELRTGVDDYRRLLGRYVRYWARGDLRRSSEVIAPAVVTQRSLQRIAQWRQRADPLIHRLQALEEEAGRLKFWLRVLGCSRHRHLDLSVLAGTGPVLGYVIAVLPGNAAIELPEPALSIRLPVEDGHCILIVGALDMLDDARHEIRAANGRLLVLPDWLHGQADESMALAARRVSDLEAGIGELYAQLDALHDEYGLAEALGDLACVDWFVEHVGELPATDHFVWVTGWTSDVQGALLAPALEQAGARALAHYPPPPDGAVAPQLLRNPSWARPFEIFTRAFGVPAGDEVDPSPLLAFVVPLLFGYMFGDVGQGASLLVLGLVLQRRWPLARLLIAAGLSAMLFGVLFGSVFSREDVLPAAWLHPFDAPLTVLLVPIVFGVLLLTAGQALSALESAWRNRLGEWLLGDGGFLLLYLGAAASFADARALPLAWAGLAWYLLGRSLIRRSMMGALEAVGQLVEDGLRLFVNTISFARVGAFALAHAGLSTAVVTLADAAGAGGFAVMLLGNLLIIALETLVVSVQTTRLVLFEFFTRFLRAEGRVFRPLAPPPTELRGESYEVAN